MKCRVTALADCESRGLCGTSRGICIYPALSRRASSSRAAKTATLIHERKTLPDIASSVRFHHRQLDKARLARRVIQTLRRFAIIPGLCPEDAWHECLRVAIVEREPA